MPAGSLDQEDIRKAEAFCKDELSSYLLYETLAEQEKGELSESLRSAAEEEKEHYLFWKGLVGRDCEARRPGRLFRVLYRLFGPVFTLQMLERREEAAARSYQQFRSRIPEELRPKLDRIIADEEGHESSFIRSLEDVRVKYLGFVALGMADAITELVGVYAGFLGATERTLIVGLAGLLVGFSAAVSMAAAAYIQARQEGHMRPSMGAVATGISYFITALLMALPYLFLSSIILSLILSLTIGVALVTLFHFYSSVVSGSSFAREVALSLAIVAGATVAGLLFGRLIGLAFHVKSLLG